MTAWYKLHPPHRSADEAALCGVRSHLLTQIHALVDLPMTLLAFVWLGLLLYDLAFHLNPAVRIITYIIWALFILDFALEFTLAPHKRFYLRQRWLTLLSLILPGLGVLRMVQMIQILQAMQVVGTIDILRLVTATKRTLRAIARLRMR